MKLKNMTVIAVSVAAFITGTINIADATNSSVSLTAAGSSFIYPVMAKWTNTYHAQTGAQINYQPIGSGGGIQQLTHGTIDFAATDKPLHTDALQNQKWRQFPAIVGGIVPVVHIAGITNNQMILTGPILADIYSSKIIYWDNKKITDLNPKLQLPHSRIISIHRADGSGTTFNFTNYLSKVSATWGSTVGYETLVKWPGFGLGAKGNAGVASLVMQMKNSIGYVEFAFATENRLAMVRLKNSSGNIISANSESFRAAANNAKWSQEKSFYQVLTNQPGNNSWPIVATTFILLPLQKNKSTMAAQAFFRWAFSHGGPQALALDYVPIPTSVTSKIVRSWR